MFALLGEVDLSKIEEIVSDITVAIGMNKEGLHAAHWKYPAFGGGGYGHTYVQPITESFVAVDSWEEHNGLYVFVASCRPFKSVEAVKEVFSKHGLTIASHQQSELSFDTSSSS